MASKRPQTIAKRAREQAVKEKRERKRQKKLDAAAAKLAGLEPQDPDAEQLDEDSVEEDAPVEP